MTFNSPIKGRTVYMCVYFFFTEYFGNKKEIFFLIRAVVLQKNRIPYNV